MPDNIIRVAAIALQQIATGMQQVEIELAIVFTLHPWDYVVHMRRLLL